VRAVFKTKYLQLFFWTAVLSIVVAAQGQDAAKNSGTSPNSYIEHLARLPEDPKGHVESDWLIKSPERRAGVFRSADSKDIVLNNGLIRRAFRLAPNAATVEFDNLPADQPLLRAVRPEAILKVDNFEVAVGGLKGQTNHGYLRREWIDSMTNDPSALQFTGFEVGPVRERLAWKRKRYSSNMPWPPPGVALTLNFSGASSISQSNRPNTLTNLSVSVHYEMYDGIPLLSKWITVSNGGPQSVTLHKFTSEVLAMIEAESVVDKREQWEYPNIHVQSDYSFRGMDVKTANQTTYWVLDPLYKTQVSASDGTPCQLESRPPIGPNVRIEPGKTFESFRTFELVHDNYDRERKGLAVRQMYRRMAPWVTENPIMMHVRSAKPEAVRLAIDQCAEVGFEMVIITFWSGFDMENEAPDYLASHKELADYAHSKGIELGGYSLLASRSVGTNDDVVDPATGKTGGTFGVSPCIGSKWGQNYFRKLYAWFEKTGFDLLEHDGSYPGDICGSTNHPGHVGVEDSQWTQWTTITEYYKWCRARGIYLNVPDLYYLNGSSKCGMGYRESNWSLPRAQQVIHARQNIFDGTWLKTPSMGWMLVPLVEYGGGGPAATIEPLSEHLDHYGLTLANNFGAGVQACYRGPRLFDTEETKQLVKKWTDFYRKYRPILDSDIIHGRRADARDIDFYLHVNPQLEEKGLIMIFNPLDHPAKKVLKVPLYYTGLTDKAKIAEQDKTSVTYSLDRGYIAELPVEMGPQSVTWFVVRK
jgi:hypothetical protein